MYYVSLYTTNPLEFARAAEVYPRHRAYVDEFALGGGIWMIGTFGHPESEGALCVFRTRQDAEAFIAADPFVTEGIVTPSNVREWNPLTYEPVHSSRVAVPDPANFVG